MFEFRGNNPVQQDNKVFVQKESPSLPASKLTFKVQNIKHHNYLSAILDFCSTLSAFVQDLDPADMVVILPAADDDEAFAQAIMFVGCYMIVYKSMTVDNVEEALRGSSGLTTENAVDALFTSARTQVRILDCWRAVERAVRLGWLVHPNSDIEPKLDVEELAHYADRANGSLHLSVPGRLFFFPTPDDLPDGQLWADHVEDSGAAARRFSAAYYAELLGFEELNVSAVASLGPPPPAAAAAFAARDLDTVDLGLAGGVSSLLGGLDRLLVLSRAAPGAVAVCSGDGSEWPEWVGTLVAAFLISREGFDEGSARAWLAMVSPWMLEGGGGGGPAGSASPAQQAL